VSKAAGDRPSLAAVLDRMRFPSRQREEIVEDVGMKSFREALSARVAELRAHPRVRVTNFWLGPPATEDELARVEAVLGPLPPSVRAFYAETNGVQLRWIDTENPGYTDADETKTVTTPSSRAFADGADADGRVDIAPVTALLEPDDSFDNGDEFRGFDVLDDYGTVAFAASEPPLSTRLRIGSDHNACWDPVPFDFADYVALVVATYGHVDRRRDACFGKASRAEVALSELVSRAPVKAERLLQGLPRVEFADERYHSTRLRGTTVSVHALGADPSSLLRIRTDLGGDVYVPRRCATPIEGTEDTYELARSDPGGYLRALTQVSPVASRGMLAAIWGEPGFGRMKLPGVPAFAPEAFRLRGLFAPLDLDTLASGLALLLLGWLQSGSRHEREVYNLADAITLFIGGEPSRLSSSAKGDITRLAAAVDGVVAAGRGEPQHLAEHARYWRDVVAGRSAPLVAAHEPWHTLGTSVGLEALPLMG